MGGNANIFRAQAKAYNGFRATTPFAKVAGRWRQAYQICVKVYGSWRPCYDYFTWTYYWEYGGWSSCPASPGNHREVWVNRTRSSTCHRQARRMRDGAILEDIVYDWNACRNNIGDPYTSEYCACACACCCD